MLCCAMLSSCQDFFCQYFKITFNTEYVKFLIDLFQISFIIRHTILSVCVCVCVYSINRLNELITRNLTCMPSKVCHCEHKQWTFLRFSKFGAAWNRKQYEKGENFFHEKHLTTFSKMHNSINYVFDENWLFLDWKFN